MVYAVHCRWFEPKWRKWQPIFFFMSDIKLSKHTQTVIQVDVRFTFALVAYLFTHNFMRCIRGQFSLPFHIPVDA